jgi:hypothetical protein
MGKIEFLAVWVLGAIAIVTRENVAFFFSLMASITIVIKNMPDVYKFIKSLKRR